MRRPMPILERFVELSNLPGSEVTFAVQLPDGKVETVNLNECWRELLEGFRAMEKLIEAVNIARAGGVGGLGTPQA